jgi:hypothetical protein
MNSYFFFQSCISNLIKPSKGKFIIKILCNESFEPFIRQQSNNGIFNNVKFVTSGKSDLIIVLNKYNYINKYANKGIPIYLWLIEPPDYLTMYTENYDLSVYEKIYTCKFLVNVSKDKQVITPPFVHWHHAYNSRTNYFKNGIMSFSNLVNHNTYKNKANKVFILDSHIKNIIGHSSRIAFIDNIKNINFDLYGSKLWKSHTRYKTMLNNFKLITQEKYKYSLVIENQLDDIYWSEKITDSFLANSFPIYYGSNSIKEYFPDGSYYNFNILENSTSDIDYLYKNVMDFVNITSMQEARELVIYKYNILNIFSNLKF